MGTPPLPGLTQYSGDPQTEWDLNAFDTKEEVLAAVRGLQYRGGNTFTGLPGPSPTLGVYSGLVLRSAALAPSQIWKRVF